MQNRNSGTLRCMSQNAYIKQFCGNSYSVFLEKAKKFPHDLEWCGFADVNHWFDFENGIEIVDSFYIGD